MVNEESVEPAAEPRVILQPIAAPSILGLYGLAGATFMVAAQMAHWFGSSDKTLLLVPFAAIFGGLAQFLAGMWAYKARDGVATAVHGMWGAFWMAFGTVALILLRSGTPQPTGPLFPEMGYWFIVLAAITWVCTGAAAAENKSLMTVLAFLAAGSTLAAIGLLVASEWLTMLAGYLFIISAIAAWYTASALMLNEAFGREVWSLGKSVESQRMPRIAVGVGEPGVIRGQA
ncbi:MAG TPA: acetate uptake transporter [Bryobacteraceae bacterium]|nr:acetate uptake transporter [Bryobacteraceae bacterium]